MIETTALDFVKKWIAIGIMNMVETPSSHACTNQNIVKAWRGSDERVHTPGVGYRETEHSHFMESLAILNRLDAIFVPPEYPVH